jgi:tetratricopeptide (TPR) repeat protein
MACVSAIADDCQDQELAEVLQKAAAYLMTRGQYDQAERMYQRAFHLFKQCLGPEHPRVGSFLHQLAEFYRVQGQYVQAESLFKQALSLLEQALGPEHPEIAFPLHELAVLYVYQGEYIQAELLFQRALQMREQSLGQNHPETAQTLHNLAVLRKSQGDISGAYDFARRASSIRSKKLGEAHSKALATERLLAELSDAQEKTTPEQRGATTSDVCREEHLAGKALLPLPKEEDSSFSPADPLQGFLDACCELHPHAWCRISDLWGAYEQWGAERQERFQLSRRAFATHIKAHGCSHDRTNTARIWRGIALRNARGMTKRDKT